MVSSLIFRPSQGYLQELSVTGETRMLDVLWTFETYNTLIIMKENMERIRNITAVTRWGEGELQ